MKDVVVIGTGVANTASVLSALKRCGVEPYLSGSDVNEDEIALCENAKAVVLPGVGHFRAGMAELKKKKLVEPIKKRIQAGKATFGICLGLQLLCESSEECPDEPGFGLLKHSIKKLPAGLTVPQMGWNQVMVSDNAGLVQSGYAYYANSYALFDIPAGWRVAISEYGKPFAAAIEKDLVVASQFHPELSGSWGIDLLRRWLMKCDLPESGRSAHSETKWARAPTFRGT